ncbi:MAG: hypothetical protein J4G00_08785 [Actinomycetia bacterium]|nr:hypothetical protein [Actinomycetes bacterium]
MPKVARLVWLDEADAGDPALVGAKACRLAQARARGLPVLNGLVVPVSVSDPVIRTGESVLRTTNNSGAARSAIFNHQPPSLLGDLAEAARELSDSLVVRSSSQAESESVWAGAFSSYLGVRPEELTQAVMGCWASVFNPNTLKREEMTGTSPHEVGMAVLIQAEIQPTCGGVATVGDDGTVRVAAALGHPTGLVAGWERGHTAIVHASGDIQAKAPPLNARLLNEIADLSRATRDKIGCNHVEWMEDREGGVLLVQAQPKSDTRVDQVNLPPPDPVQDTEPWMNTAVRMMTRFPGPVGEKLVWPWAIGLKDLSPAPVEHKSKPMATLIEDVRQGAGVLTAMRFEGADSLADVDRAWSALRKSDPSPLRDLISGHPDVDRRLASAHLRNLRDLGLALTTAGVIPHPRWVWYLDPDNFDRPYPDQQGPMRRIGTTLWDAWIFGVITSQGKSIAGTPASGGWGVGRLRFIRNADDAASFSPREVIATSHPVGNIAPLLWHAAGLVTAEGSPGAHLFEVAEWLAVPALCGVDLHPWTVGREQTEEEEDVIVAVDGDQGLITRLP